MVSETVSNLEEQIGVPLFDRSGRYPKLTPAGVALLADARNIITGVDLLKVRAKGMAVGLEPELSVVVDVFYPIDAITQVAREFGAWNMFDADVLAWHFDAGIDKRFLGDLAEIQLTVEPRAAALAAARRSDADILELQRSMDRMRQEASDSIGFADADLALHIAVANASGNLFMRSIGNVIEAALRASFLLSAPIDPEDRETVLLWHQRIVDGIASGDGEAAARAMVDVIHNGMRRHERSADVQATTVVTTDELDSEP